ncbi:hypothetical protein KAU15_07535, partial [candidate division WOR-3 bacterium]|nr:hypothetical protein [candidate division WOR-3 bacterium]
MKNLFVFFLVLIGLIAFGQGFVMEHRNIPIAPEIVEIVDSFLIIGAGRFIEVYNIESDTINKINTNEFNGYVYDIQYDDNYIYISPLRFLGDSIKIFFRDSLPHLVEHSSLYGRGSFSVNDSLLVTGTKYDTLLIYKRDSIGGNFSLITNHRGLFCPDAYPTMIFDTFYMPSYSIADILNPYELSSHFPSPYIIENDTILYGYSYNGDIIAVYNISDMSNPLLLDTIFHFTTSLSAAQCEKQRMKKIGNYLYINFNARLGDYGDFIIYNVSDLQNVVEVNRFDFTLHRNNKDFTNDVDIYNDQLFFSKSEHGLQVYDINDTVHPVFNYSLGIAPVFPYSDIYRGRLFNPIYINNQYYMPDYNGIYFANKDGWNDINYKNPFDSIAGFCGIDSVVLITDVRNTGTGILSILNEDLSVIDSVTFVSYDYPYDIIIPYRDYVLLKHIDSSCYLKTYWKLFKRDTNNHLTYIDSINLYSSMITDFEIMGNNLIILDSCLKLFDISDIENTHLICSLPVNNEFDVFMNVLTHKRDYLFYINYNTSFWNTELYCFHLKSDTLEEIWDTTFIFSSGGIGFVNNYLVLFPNIFYNVTFSLVYDVADPENPGNAFVSRLFE